MPKYQREQIVIAFENAVVIRAHLLFILLTWPSKINRCFPFHVRTTQIGAMIKSNVMIGNSKLTFATKRAVQFQSSATPKLAQREGFVGESIDRFSQHQYAMTTSMSPTDLITRPPTAAVCVQKSMPLESSSTKQVANSAGIATVGGFDEHQTRSMPEIG